MKRITTLLLAAVIMAMPSCKNNNKANQQQDDDYSQATSQELTAEALEVDMANLIESAKKIKAVPFIKSQKDGKLVLSDKEKMVKPDYLTAPEAAAELVTLNQKYRAVGILTSDKSIAELYDMPVTGYSENILKLLTDIKNYTYKRVHSRHIYSKYRIHSKLRICCQNSNSSIFRIIIIYRRT